MPKLGKNTVKTPKVVKKVREVKKEVICGHEQVTHPEKCHVGEIQDCELLYWSCGEHGKHYEKECQKLCV
jgi:hypothetical protein